MINHGCHGEATGRILGRLAERIFRSWRRDRDGTIDGAR